MRPHFFSPRWRWHSGTLHRCLEHRKSYRSCVGVMGHGALGIPWFLYIVMIPSPLKRSTVPLPENCCLSTLQHVISATSWTVGYKSLQREQDRQTWTAIWTDHIQSISTCAYSSLVESDKCSHISNWVATFEKLAKSHQHHHNFFQWLLPTISSSLPELSSWSRKNIQEIPYKCITNERKLVFYSTPTRSCAIGCLRITNEIAHVTLLLQRTAQWRTVP